VTDSTKWKLKYAASIVVCVGVAMAIRGLAITLAHAQSTPPPKGLFAEVATSVDGATVRRIRDREEDVVCYVATGIPKAGYGTEGRNVAISCVRLFVVNP
jgi:hypothetical protein